MDDLPKNQSGTQDIASFAGSYPKDVNQGSQVPITSLDAQSVPFAAESGSVPKSSNQNASSAPTAASPELVVSAFEGANPQVSSPMPSSSVLPTPENPFIAQAVTVSSSKGGSGGAVKRVGMIVGLIILLIVIGFVAFNLVGRFLANSQPKVLTYWGLWENEQVLTGLIEEYQKEHPNVQIAYAKQSPRQYRERLDAAIRRGEGPDIFRFHNTWMPMLQDLLSPAGSTGYTQPEFASTFYPVANQDLVVNNQVYGAPLMFDGLGLYYNEDLLRAAGVTPPTSWEDFRNAALTLTVKNEAGEIVTAGAALGTTANVEHFSDILAVMMMQNGATLTNPNSPEAAQAISFYRLFAEQPGNVWDNSLDNSILAFANGKVAFIFAPSWEVFTIREINPQLKFQIIPIPQLPGVTVNWASYWVEGVSNKSEHAQEAWDFLKFISSKESMIKLYTEQSKLRPFGEPYSRSDLAQTVINDPFVGAYIRQAPTAQSFFLASRTFDNGINDQLIKYLGDAVNSIGQSVSAEDALATMGQGFSQILSQYGFSPGQR